MNDWFGWFWEIWESFDKAGPIANFIQIATPIMAFVTAVYFWLRRSVKHKDTEIANLKGDVARREEASQRAAARAEKFEKNCAYLESRFAAAALRRAEREWLDGNDTKAQYELALWLEREGEAIARLLAHQANWAAARAVGELRAAGLIVAEVFTQACMALDPTDKRAFECARDLATLRETEAQASPVFAAALELLRNKDAALWFDADEVSQALAARREAEELGIRGYYHLSLVLIERAVRLLQRQLGPGARQTLSARRMRIHLLIDRGELETAMIEAVSVVDDAVVLGTDHPDTLAGRYLLAGVLSRSGKPDKALPIIREVVSEQQASPALGPSHPETLMGGHLQAEVLCHLGKPGEALPVIQQVVTGQRANPALGPSHPHTLMSGYLLARVLTDLSKSGEALPIIRKVLAEQEASPALGPRHPHTLTSRLLLAQVLKSLGKPEEALPIIEEVAVEREANSALGSNHPQTLFSRQLLATVLERLGKPEQALPIIQEVIAKAEASPALGPIHPETLMCCQLLARVLTHLDKSGEALPVIRKVVAVQEVNPALGPKHPHTLTSRQLLALILYHLGEGEEALPVIREVLAEQEANPALGPEHPDTTVSRFIMTVLLKEDVETHAP